ncbi:efflux RND transporter periplasmic adaptor subunit [Shewanella sp. GD03713]|uniref:efflux RND transporter periplasmic adaptor subunit n=1 Tax=Shewanella sp. GD03713 TaxID=2975372 RepID=UPI000B344CBF|nr:efflux RND transporter periplasmic adaptor subunit [Shewanella sp. GD03713]MDH1470361.1 efflux RND transporter periplasmic adaptor subunit [Shewanella sp. GD03713]QXN23140.1 efflux RND transporter periplasmic adaptor subunit [Shewanella putrefaciens]VEE64224.1 Multidrug resistance protein mexA precursor [Shewanella putrefaciens]
MSNGVQLPPAPVEDNQHLKTTLLITAVFLALVLGGVYYLKAYLAGHQSHWQPQAVPVSAMQVTAGPLPMQLTAVGELTAVQQVTLSADVAGRVDAIRFHSGEHVKPQQLLVELYNGPEQATLQAAQARLAYAKHQLARSQQLAPSGAESLDVLQERQSAFAQAQADVQAAQAQLRQKQILAPFAGELGIRQIDLGEYVNPGAAAVTLTALDKLYVEFTLPQQNFAAIKVGGDIMLSSDVYPQQQFSAKVHAVEPQLDSDTRNIRVQGEFNNAEQLLRPGMYVNAALQLPAAQNTIVVPATAVQTSAQGYSMVVVRGDNAKQQGKADIVAVEIGKRIDNRIQITSGIQAGDVIVVTGQNRVQPGADVVVQNLLAAGE